MSHYPTSELVVVTWLRQRVALAGAQVATALPSELPAEGFITVAAVPSAALVDGGGRLSVLTLDAWAAPANGGSKPPWNRAAQLAEVVRNALASDVQVFGKLIDLGPDYFAARMLSLYMTTEPRRVNGDPSAYARYTFDVAASWVMA